MFVRYMKTLLIAPLNIIYSVKWIISYIVICVYNACNSRRFDFYDIRATGDPVKLGYLVPQLEKDLESPLSESHLHNGTDEVLFYGVNSKSEYIILRITRDFNQEAEAWIYLKLANGKTYHLVENLGYQQSFEEKCSTFSCGNLQMFYLAPMRRWRISYCGMLRETSQITDKTETEESVFVKFVFLWKASSHAYNLSPDTNPNGFASSLARSEWKIPFVPPVNKFADALDFYSQPGVITGTISVDEGPEYEMYLFGEKMRYMGKMADIAGCKFTNILGHIPQTGHAFNVGQVTAPYVFNDLPFGFVVQPGGYLEVVKEVELNIKVLDQKTSRNNIKANFISNENFEITGTTLCHPIVLHSNLGWNGFIEARQIEFSVQNKKGFGLIIVGEVYKKASRSIKSVPFVQFPNSIPLSTKISDDISHFVDISGGKGSSLGKLAQLSKKIKTFTVPKGIIVTTAAFENFLTSEINDAVKCLENRVYGNTVGDVKEACNLVASIIEKSHFPNNISHSINKSLTDIFGDEIHSKKFAVRSSATGEDSSTMSAAGQMETFLGVQSLEEIFKAVKKCWASQFGYNAVEYKRHNGQILNSSMAVVIQEMVACEVSGVLFTCNPVNNNPSLITITGNYGLGETVVSGSVEPDTIVLRRKENGQLDMESVHIGTKDQRMVMQESGGTLIEDLPENLKSATCLSEETAKCLGKLAIKVENFYKSPRDIEWGLIKDKIYIFQSRPITSIISETDFEIKHEFDIPMMCEREYITIANIGEVMPGAASPLGLQTILQMFSIAMGQLANAQGVPDNFQQNQYFSSSMLWPFYNHMMATVVDLLNRYGTDSPTAKGMMVSVFGRILDDPELLDYAREKAAKIKAPPKSIKAVIRFFWDLFFCAYNVDKIKENLDNYDKKFLKTKTAKDTFKTLMNSCSDFDKGFFTHLGCSEISSQWNMYLFTILSNAAKESDQNIYGDFAKLLATSSNAESADVPRAMQELAFHIGQDLDIEEFKCMSVEDAEQWLKTSSSNSGYKFRNFLKRHGHRCLKESDVYSITWAMNPKPLIKSLQNLAGTCKDDGTQKKDNDYEKLFSKLNVPLDFWSRCMLKFVIPNCHRSVCEREAGKSLTMKGINYWRQGCRYLAKLMVSEGRIPDEDLLFFFTLNEIDELLKSRSPRIISRAIHRRKLFPVLNGYKFPEMGKGIPKPINDIDDSSETYEFVADLSMKGTPVSQGIAKGFARVAVLLEEAAALKPGEILITHSTDIGWSPYFPIVSGVVTELGGIISHGAVVSREYGLPCVVGLHGATKKFQTGDYVLVDGNKGILQRLPQPELLVNDRI